MKRNRYRQWKYERDDEATQRKSNQLSLSDQAAKDYTCPMLNYPRVPTYRFKDKPPDLPQVTVEPPPPTDTLNLSELRALESPRPHAISLFASVSDPGEFFHPEIDLDAFKSSWPQPPQVVEELPKIVEELPKTALPKPPERPPILERRFKLLDFLFLINLLILPLRKRHASKRFDQAVKAHNEAYDRAEQQLERINKKHQSISEYNKARKRYWKERDNSFRMAEAAYAERQSDFEKWEDARAAYRRIRDCFIRIHTDTSSSAIADWWKYVQMNSGFPTCLPYQHEVHCDPEANIIVFNLAIPDFAKLNIVKTRELKTRNKVVPANKAETKEALERLFFGYPVRLAYEIANSPIVERYGDAVINSYVHRADPATGHPRSDCVASIMIRFERIKNVLINQIDPQAAYRSFKGTFGGAPEDVIETIPILTFDEDSDRFVEGREIIDGAAGTNLATLDWEDFEHFIRELFEKEFGHHGAEVKVTRASRDRGVDAVVLDPDPIRGGKFVVQAKRYTNTVDVSAVRDLYGTVMNEGANRGILVTTSSYGRDAYNFAKDKPLTLLNGGDLVTLLRRHGYEYIIDLKAAKKFFLS